MVNEPIGSRFYGRRKGRPLRKGMKALLTDILPTLRYDAARMPAEQFRSAAGPVGELALEIGFGGGEHLADLAEANPRTNYIGAEPFVNGVASLLRHIQKRHLSNILIWDDDVRLIMQDLPLSGLSQVFILFPDPWPKKRHATRRILQPEMMDILAQLIRPGGQLVLASDDPIAKSWLLQTAISHRQFCWTARRPVDWRDQPLHFPPTRYMVKAIKAARRPSWFIFDRCL